MHHQFDWFYYHFSKFRARVHSLHLFMTKVASVTNKGQKETFLVQFCSNGVVFNMFHAVYSVYMMKLHFLIKNKTFTSEKS